MCIRDRDSECYVISGPAFVSVSEANPKIKIFSLETAISRFSDVMWVMQQILFMSMDQRLAIFLTDESKRLGSDTIPFTHEQIAKYMGSAREVVTRMLKYFASEGLCLLYTSGGDFIPKGENLSVNRFKHGCRHGADTPFSTYHAHGATPPGVCSLRTL